MDIAGLICYLALLAVPTIATAVSITAFRRRRKYIYVRLINAANGKPLQSAPVFVERNAISFQPSFLGQRSGVSQYAYTEVSEQYAEPLCLTDNKGEFRHRIAWRATYGFSVKLSPKEKYAVIYADHVAQTGGFPDRPVVLRVPDEGGILLPATMLAG